MPFLHLTPALIARTECFQAQFHADRMGALAALAGDPFGVEVRPFGSGFGVACKVRHPLLRSKNRIHGVGAAEEDILDDLLRFYRADGLPCSLSVLHGEMSEALFARLTSAGLWSAGSGTAPAIVPDECAAESAPPEVTIRPSGPEEKELYLDLFQQAFAGRSESDSEYRAIQWAEDSLPGGARYIAEVGGKPVGMASFPIVDGVGYFGTGGVLPEFRRRGLQTALIRRRLADAPRLGCDLALGGGSPGTTTYRNFERAGLRLIPAGMHWSERHEQAAQEAPASSSTASAPATSRTC